MLKHVSRDGESVCRACHEQILAMLAYDHERMARCSCLPKLMFRQFCLQVCLCGCAYHTLATTTKLPAIGVPNIHRHHD